jgi:hypothetical protein
VSVAWWEHQISQSEKSVRSVRGMVFLSPFVLAAIVIGGATCPMEVRLLCNLLVQCQEQGRSRVHSRR